MTHNIFINTKLYREKKTKSHYDEIDSTFDIKNEKGM